MPIYEYVCGECGSHFDLLQKWGDAGPGSCPNGHRDIHRLLSQPAIIFKGSGFYVTDNGRNGRRKTGSGKKTPDSNAASTVGAEKKAGDSEA
jgi:putative FmdB family regulatory protein